MSELTVLLKALADPNRLRLLAAIETHGELCACQLTELLGVTGATCSQHLSLLVKVGLLRRRRAGRWMHFSRQAAGLSPELTALVDHIIAIFCDGSTWHTDGRHLEEILLVTPQKLCLHQRS